MTHGDLFAGIGGFTLAAEWCGLETKWAIEIDPYCQRVYRKHFPDVEVYGDVRAIQSVPHVDLITAGFPCQPVSVAGKRLGTDDERWMWPDTIRIIRLVRPRWALLENVPGLLGRGMSDVLGDLAASGYDAEWDCIPAAAVGAPHRRDRVWIVAYSSSNQLWHEPRGRSGESRADTPIFRNNGPKESMADTPSQRRSFSWGNCGTESAHARFTDADWWTTEPNVGRVAHGVPARVDRLRALGNAIVPQVAAWIIGRIMEEA